MNPTIIITLRADRYERDFELPCTVKLSELYPRLTAALQKASPTVFGDYEGVILEKDESGLLDPNATLSDYGICTGSILRIVRKEKYDGFQRRYDANGK